MSITLEARSSAAGSASVFVTKSSFSPGFQVIRRSGGVTPFDPTKISVALTKAFLALEGQRAAASRRVHEIVEADRADRDGLDASRR